MNSINLHVPAIWVPIVDLIAKDRVLRPYLHTQHASDATRSLFLYEFPKKVHLKKPYQSQPLPSEFTHPSTFTQTVGCIEICADSNNDGTWDGTWDVGASVNSNEGDVLNKLGVTLGNIDSDGGCKGYIDGCDDSIVVGVPDAIEVGKVESSDDGCNEFTVVGVLDVIKVGNVESSNDGSIEGNVDGSNDGPDDGSDDTNGSNDGRDDNIEVGCVDGSDDGSTDGSADLDGCAVGCVLCIDEGCTEKKSVAETLGLEEGKWAGSLVAIGSGIDGWFDNPSCEGFAVNVGEMVDGDFAGPLDGLVEGLSDGIDEWYDDGLCEGLIDIVGAFEWVILGLFDNETLGTLV